ncbi:hypothetical protein F4779DRAFT_591627 [Xylariaceae sp. FL0662B]|nr:hypothetical protein F4779DRAFT_591627 [Xylariaceae sp. FL0662B]
MYVRALSPKLVPTVVLCVLFPIAKSLPEPALSRFCFAGSVARLREPPTLGRWSLPVCLNKGRSPNTYLRSMHVITYSSCGDSCVWVLVSAIWLISTS